ncbi:MAG: hypothetical protein M3Y87_13240, partial [Myxococcota bacterium]|nr:hypothetical protein [Myxococcota bacterium]
MRSLLEGVVSLTIIVLAMIAGAAPALAQRPDAVVTWDVPCGDEAAFVAGVSELGASFEGFEVLVGVEETEAGSFRGRLSIRRSGEPLVDRELEDELCHDVLDALVIAAALALRSLPGSPPEPPSEVVTVAPAIVAEDVVAEAPEEIAAQEPTAEGPPASPSARFALGASLRVGLGPA